MINRPYAFVFALLLAFSSTSCAPKEEGKTADDANATATQQDCYELFPTSNMWTFVKLDTRDGRLWQVQYDIEGDDRMQMWLNSTPLSDVGNAPGRYTLYPTQNIYNFILLDQKDGRMWQVQWSIEEENRMILPI